MARVFRFGIFAVLTAGLCACGASRLNPWFSAASVPSDGGCVYLTGRLILDGAGSAEVETPSGARYSVTSPREIVRRPEGLIIAEVVSGAACHRIMPVPWPPPRSAAAWIHDRPGFKVLLVSHGRALPVQVSAAKPQDFDGLRPESSFPWPCWPWTCLPSGCCAGVWRLDLPPLGRWRGGRLAVRACVQGRWATLWWPAASAAELPPWERKRGENDSNNFRSIGCPRRQGARTT